MGDVLGELVGGLIVLGVADRVINGRRRYPRQKTRIVYRTKKKKKGGTK